ncbi:hypothetical protein OSTOST_13693, partial [Ostertagia ostertagi]
RSEAVRRKEPRKQHKPATNVELRCDYCNESLTSFDEETISLCLIAVETFLHREPVMAAPILFSLLHTVTRLIDHPIYPWHDSEMFVPGNCRSVAKQMLRVTLHQVGWQGKFQWMGCAIILSGICSATIRTAPLSAQISFWKVALWIVTGRLQELSPVYFIQLLFEVSLYPIFLEFLEIWTSSETLSGPFRELAYHVSQLQCAIWPHTSLKCHLMLTSTIGVRHHSHGVIFQAIHTQISVEGAAKPSRSEVESAIVVMSHVLKSAVSLVDSFCKWLAEALHECPVKLESLLTICTACNRALIRERDKQSVSRAVVAEMIQAIKFKCPMHEANFITIAHLILQDAGEDIEMNIQDDQFNTAASEAVRPFLFEILDFIADLHVLAKLKKETNSDSVGGDLKGEAGRSDRRRNESVECS